MDEKEKDMKPEQPDFSLEDILKEFGADLPEIPEEDVRIWDGQIPEEAAPETTVPSDTVRLDEITRAVRRMEQPEDIPAQRIVEEELVLDDLKTMHNPASNVVNEWSVYYFPHVFSDDYAAGWYDKVEAMQGKYDTFYAGEVMSFGDMDETAEYSRELVERFF